MSNLWRPCCLRCPTKSRHSSRSANRRRGFHAAVPRRVSISRITTGAVTGQLSQHQRKAANGPSQARSPLAAQCPAVGQAPVPMSVPAVSAGPADNAGTRCLRTLCRRRGMRVLFPGCLRPVRSRRRSLVPQGSPRPRPALCLPRSRCHLLGAARCRSGLLPPSRIRGPSDL